MVECYNLTAAGTRIKRAINDYNSLQGFWPSRLLVSPKMRFKTSDKRTRHVFCGVTVVTCPLLHAHQFILKPAIKNDKLKIWQRINTENASSP